MHSWSRRSRSTQFVERRAVRPPGTTRSRGRATTCEVGADQRQVARSRSCARPHNAFRPLRRSQLRHARRISSTLQRPTARRGDALSNALSVYLLGSARHGSMPVPASDPIGRYLFISHGLDDAMRGHNVALDYSSREAFDDEAQATGRRCCRGQKRAIDQSASPLDAKALCHVIRANN